MSLNHYAKMKRILDQHPEWIVRQVNEPTRATKFHGESIRYDHYYRVYDGERQPIKYCKFQQLERFARTMGIAVEDIPIIDT